MKKRLLLFVLLHAAITGNLLADAVKDLKTEAKSVTLFTEGAQVFREGKIDLPSGTYTIIASNLSPFVKRSSIQVKSSEAVEIHSVKFNIDYLRELDPIEEIENLRMQLEAQSEKLKLKNNERLLLHEELTFLKENRDIGGKQTGISLEQLSSINNYHRERLKAIFAQRSILENEIGALESSIDKINKAIKGLLGTEDDAVGEIHIKVKVRKAAKANFHISYLVTEAGWFPFYDVRVKYVSAPLQLTYKAKLFQNSGENWKNVKLSVSTGNPNQNQEKPTLTPWFLGYGTANNSLSIRSGFYSGQVTGVVYGEEDGKPIPGVNVILKGSTAGTVTDLDGRYSVYVPDPTSTLVFSFIGLASEEVTVGNNSVINMNMTSDHRQLSEVVVTGYSGRSRPSKSKNKREYEDFDKAYTQQTQNQISTVYTINERVSLPDRTANETVILTSTSLKASYEYTLIPKLSTSAFLTAQALEWENPGYLEGESSVFFEGTYVGNMLFNPAQFSDTLQLSLGADNSISIKREKVAQNQKRQVIGQFRTDSRKLSIQVKNSKKTAVKVSIYDQLPVSTREEITIESVELSKAKLNEENGILQWKKTIDAGENINLTFAYEVKYPKDKTIRID